MSCPSISNAQVAPVGSDTALKVLYPGLRRQLPVAQLISAALDKEMKGSRAGALVGGSATTAPRRNFAPPPLHHLAFRLWPLLARCAGAKENMQPAQQQQQQPEQRRRAVKPPPPPQANANANASGSAAHLGSLLAAAATCLSVGLLHRVTRQRQALRSKDEELQRARSDLDSKSSQVEELAAELEGARSSLRSTAAELEAAVEELEAKTAELQARRIGLGRSTGVAAAAAADAVCSNQDGGTSIFFTRTVCQLLLLLHCCVQSAQQRLETAAGELGNTRSRMHTIERELDSTRRWGGVGRGGAAAAAAVCVSRMPLRGCRSGREMCWPHRFPASCLKCCLASQLSLGALVPEDSLATCLLPAPFPTWHGRMLRSYQDQLERARYDLAASRAGGGWDS